ncbi:hypothetical protein MTO96_045774 [Rhipicephalus appendiculatus]
MHTHAVVRASTQTFDLRDCEKRGDRTNLVSWTLGERFHCGGSAPWRAWVRTEVDGRQCSRHEEQTLHRETELGQPHRVVSGSRTARSDASRRGSTCAEST